MKAVMSLPTDSTPCSRQLRAQLRRLLRLARQGDSRAYVELAEPYLNLITEFLGLSGAHDPNDRRRRAGHLLADLWKFLPFTRKVADFERLLAGNLFALRAVDIPAGDFPCAALFHLDPRERFVVVARELERWDETTTAAALRISRRQAGDTLFTLRARVLGFDTASLDDATVACMRHVSRDFDGQHTPREKLRLCQQLGAQPKAREFKSEWLELRCRLIEYRQQIRMTDEEKATILSETATALAGDQMIQVRLLDRFVGRIGTRSTHAATS